MKSYPNDISGNIYVSDNFGRFKVLERVENQGNKICHKVEFLETGTIDIFQKTNILSGRIKDKYKKSIYGVACSGKSSKKENKKEYDLWFSMIGRCYNKNHDSYRDYGIKGITVCVRWLCFENFLADVVNIKGYNSWCGSQSDYHLDKDYLQQDKERSSKVYSPDTCIFLNKESNLKKVYL